MIEQFQILPITEKIDNSISYHASKVLSFLVGISDTYFHA